MTSQEILIAAASDLELIKMGFWQSARLFENQMILSALKRNGDDFNKSAHELQLSRQLFNYHFVKIKKRRKIWPSGEKRKTTNPKTHQLSLFRFPAEPQKKKIKGVSVEDLIAASEKLERLKRGQK